MLGDRPQVNAGLVGGVGHVDHDCQVGLQGEATGPRAREGRLLLGDGQRQHVPGCATGFGHQARRLGGHEAPDPVVQGP